MLYACSKDRGEKPHDGESNSTGLQSRRARNHEEVQDSTAVDYEKENVKVSVQTDHSKAVVVRMCLNEFCLRVLLQCWSPPSCQSEHGSGD
jgi:hypothetical protein